MNGDSLSRAGIAGSPAPDLTLCDREPIHIPGSIQPHGALLALDPGDLRVMQAGGDTKGLLGAVPEALLGAPVTRVLTAGQAAQLRRLIGSGRLMARPMHAFGMPARAGRPARDAVLHQSGAVLVLEIEPRSIREPDDALALVHAMLRQVQTAATVQIFCEAIAAEVRAVCGFDRVMIYRFMPDGAGAVVAEARGDDIDSFLGLHYPASDIPKQARALYLANWIRMIPDARYAPAPVLPVINPMDGQPLDLSQSVLRSVSPVHRQYLANMGVVASMSLSIILRGQLWGLVVCHHLTPRYLPHRLRLACEMFAEIVSSQLELKVAAEDFGARLHAKRIHEDIVRRMSQSSGLAEGLLGFHSNLLEFIPSSGVGLWIDGRFTGLGDTPTSDQVQGLVAWLNAAADEGVFHTDQLPLLYPPAEAYSDVASGILVLSVSKLPRDYVIWFRPEVIRTVTWGGNPDKPAAAAPDGEVLTPRTSFAAWKQSVRLHSSPWLDADVDAAHRLLLSVLEVVLQRIDQIAREREAARLRQEQLMQELDRRLKLWRSTAKALKLETQRRAVVEAELSQVLRRTVADQEAERLRIARELHDTLGQSLTLLQLGLQGIGTAPLDGAEIKLRVITLNAMAAEAGRQVNRLAWEIRPTALDDLGIQTAIRNLLESWGESTGIRFDLHLTLDERRLPPVVETTLYRVLQEALTNVVRHAEAKRVGVILRMAEQHVTMIIEDDGRGFGWEGAEEADTPTARRLGLLGIRERLALVNGSLEIETSPGKGATVFVRIPV
jgi:chemotaxis family two-component system sensor kinase Cph1